MVLSFLFGRKKRQKMGDELYSYVRNAARQPNFFGEGRVPDTVDGRFDVLVIHAFLAMRALRQAEPEQRLDQLLFDAMFRDLDSAIRELGASDTVVGKRVKAMAKAFYGRSERYHGALESADLDQMREAVERNLLSTTTITDAHSEYVKNMVVWFERSNTRLATQDINVLLENGPDYAPFG